MVIHNLLQKVFSTNVQSNISSKRLILPATTSSFVGGDTSRTSSEYSDAMSHMMKAAKEFQVAEPSNRVCVCIKDKF